MANEKKYITIEVADTLDVEFGATAEQLLPLIETNNKLATTTQTLAEQVLPTIASGLQSKEVTPTDIEQVVRADDGYLGLSKVTIAATEKDVRIVNRRVNDSDYLYYMEDIAATYQRSDYAVCVAGEFSKDADMLILSGADAYLTSDGDFYTSGTTHTWHDFDDIHGNRWVVYYFVEGNNNSNFMIADATACPIVLAVKGHLGAIISGVKVPIKNVIVAEDSSILDIRITGNTDFLSNIYIRNIKTHTSGYITINVLNSAVIDIEEATTALNYGEIYNQYFPKLRIANTLQGQYKRTLYIPELEMCNSLTGRFDNVYLKKIDAPKLKYKVGEEVFIRSSAVEEINIPSFVGVKAYSNWSSQLAIFYNINQIEEINLPNFVGSLDTVSDFKGYVVKTAAKLKRLILPKFKKKTYDYIFSNCPLLEYVYVPLCTNIQMERYNSNTTSNMPNLHTFIIGGLKQESYGGTDYQAFLNCPRLIHLEATMEQDKEVRLPKWEPTEAINDNTDLIEDSTRCTTNRQQFFVNFIEYILHKLKDCSSTTKLTLTLSATVYDAIFSDESGFAYNGQSIADYVTSYIAKINWSIAKA